MIWQPSANDDKVVDDINRNKKERDVRRMDGSLTIQLDMRINVWQI